MHSRVWVLLFLAVCSAPAQVTYSREVSRLMQAKCQQCHRPGDIAPFPLTSYAEAQERAPDILDAVGGKRMPPWKPAPGYGEFRDNFGLSDDERRTLLEWAGQGAPEGDPADLPEPLPSNTSEWELGDPDLVLAMPEYTPPRGKDHYRCFVLPSGLEETRYVSAVQAVPGDRRQVHHVLLFIDTTGESETLDAQDEAPGYTCFGGPGIPLSIDGALGGWAPGLRTRHLPDGIGLRLPAGARIVMQVHYHPEGRQAPDQTRIGLWFRPRDVPQKRLIYVPIVNTGFEIPAGAKDYEVTASIPVLPFLTGKAINVAPHMHLLGKSVRVEIEDPDGTRRPMIYIDQWDFNWQNIYTFVEPMALPAGAVVRLTATYDNSAENPRNPNYPPKAVRWGEGTEDEMCLAFVGVVFDNEALLPR